MARQRHRVGSNQQVGARCPQELPEASATACPPARSEVIKRRQIILVRSSERGNKGAALTTSSRQPLHRADAEYGRGGGISRKIATHRTGSASRRAESRVPEAWGSSSVRWRGPSRRSADFEYLLRLWERTGPHLRSTAPCLVYEEGNLIKLRDLIPDRPGAGRGR